MSNTQFEFEIQLVQERYTRGLQVLVQRTMDVNNDVYTCFIDYQKISSELKMISL